MCHPDPRSTALPLRAGPSGTPRALLPLAPHDTPMGPWAVLGLASSKGVGPAAEGAARGRWLVLEEERDAGGGRKDRGRQARATESEGRRPTCHSTVGGHDGSCPGLRLGRGLEGGCRSGRERLQQHLPAAVKRSQWPCGQFYNKWRQGSIRRAIYRRRRGVLPPLGQGEKETQGKVTELDRLRSPKMCRAQRKEANEGTKAKELQWL